jgi:DNA-damage-inducible protein D
MNNGLIIKMQSQFDQLAQTHPEELHLEFWFARDLQEPLGYARWENFLTAIQRAIESCKTTRHEPGHHFRGVTKWITHGKSSPNPSVPSVVWLRPGALSIFRISFVNR